MNPRVRSLTATLVGMAMGVGGWFATLWAASDFWTGVAFSSIVLLLIAAAFRGRFARLERARDFWTGFALFGLAQVLASRPNGPDETMVSIAIDRIGDRVLGVEEDFPTFRSDLTPLGLSLAKVQVTGGGGSLFAYLTYFRETTKRFAGLAVAAIGGLAACHLRRRSVGGVPSPRLGGCPPLGIAWLYLLAGLIGGTFVLHTRPALVGDGWFQQACPGSEAAHFALFNVELLAVLFAALEARFASESERPWWLGFALFGGAYLLALDGSLAAIPPAKWTGDLFQWVYYRFVSDSQQPSVSVRGVIMIDYETTSFFRSGLTWAVLAAFLPVAWLGTLAARLARRLGDPSSRRDWLGRWRVRSGIGRMMVALATIGLFLGALKDPAEWKVTALGDGLIALLLVAALRSWFGPEASRSWWWGFALVGGVNLLLGAKLDRHSIGIGYFDSGWPLHEAVSQLHRWGFESQIGERVPTMPMFDVMEESRRVIYDAYWNSRSLLLMGVCLPMAWVGATLAAWLDRRRRAAEFPQ
jgi:hypothetical protein